MISSARDPCPAPMAKDYSMVSRFATDNRHAETGVNQPRSPTEPALGTRLRWYVPRALGEETAISVHPSHRLRGGRRWVAVTVTTAVLASVAAGCGSSAERQDANEPEGKFPVEVVAAKFPTEQRLAQTSDLQLEIRNSGDKEIPDLAVTINTGDELSSGPFSVRSDQQGLADPNRPVWILEEGYPKLLTDNVSEKDLDNAPSAGAAAAQTNTFSFGSVPAGESKNIDWRVTPVKPGTFTVHYELAAGLGGKAKAVTSDGSTPEGEFVVTITDKPPKASVDDSGNVVEQGG